MFGGTHISDRKPSRSEHRPLGLDGAAAIPNFPWMGSRGQDEVRSVVQRQSCTRLWPEEKAPDATVLHGHSSVLQGPARTPCNGRFQKFSRLYPEGRALPTPTVFDGCTTAGLIKSITHSANRSWGRFALQYAAEPAGHRFPNKRQCKLARPLMLCESGLKSMVLHSSWI